MLKSIGFCLAAVLAAGQAWANTDCDGHDIGRVVATCGVPYGQVTSNQFSNIYEPDSQIFPKATHPVAIFVHGSNGYSGGDLHAYTLANDGFLVFQAEYDVVNAGPGNLDLFQSFHEMQLLIRWIRKFASLYDADTAHIGPARRLRGRRCGYPRRQLHTDGYKSCRPTVLCQRVVRQRYRSVSSNGRNLSAREYGGTGGRR